MGRSRVRAARVIVVLAMMLAAGACLPVLGNYVIVEAGPSMGTKKCNPAADECSPYPCATVAGASVGVCSDFCKTGSPCPDGLACFGGSCLRPCAKDSDCASGFRCRQTRGGASCVPEEWKGAGATCSADADCGPLHCTFQSSGVPMVCAFDCSDKQCPTGAVCVPRYSACLAQCGTGAPCAGGFVCTGSGTLGPVCVPAGWMTGMTGKGCTGSYDCDVFDCAKLDANGNGVCAARCDGTPCPSGTTCTYGGALKGNCLIDCSADASICNNANSCTPIGGGSSVCTPKSWAK